MKIRLLRPTSKMPTYAKPGDAGADLYADIDCDIWVSAGAKPRVIPVGIAIGLEPGHEAQIRPRSGLSKAGLWVATGTIDSGYRGEIGVCVVSVYGSHVIKPGDRIAQMVVGPVQRAIFRPVDELDETERGASGFGSSGR